MIFNEVIKSIMNFLIGCIEKIVLVSFLCLSFELYAKCEGDIIDKSDVVYLPDNALFKDIVLMFGNGCLGGKEIINTYYREKEGKHVFFFFKNKPKRAFEYLKEKNPRDIPVYMAVLVDLDGKNKEIIWPKKLIEIGYENALKKEYYKKNKACIPAKIDSRLLSNLDVNVLSVADVFSRFGKTCFAGYTALTLQYIDENGFEIWFWLSNKPNPASSLIKLNKKNLINVFLIEKKLSESKESGQVIWPTRLRGTDLRAALHAEYFSK